MSPTPYGFLPPPAPDRPTRLLERWASRIAGWLGWLVLAAVGVVFLGSLLIWLVVMVVASLLASVLTGRPAGVALLWQRYRAMARQRWPHAPEAAESNTPRADAAQATGASMDTGVTDVRWRDVPAARTDGDGGTPPR